MRIAMVHYHLRVGGVSRVIELACRALRESGHRIAVLAGEANSTISNLVPTATLAGLDYNNFRSSSQAHTLQQELEKTARRLLGGPPDVWHIHNHSLGKNLLLPEIITSWAKKGQALLLQIHDFAENQRPINYQQLLNTYGSSLNTFLYPCTSRIAYAVLNSRDEQLLQRANFPGNFFPLPNPALPLPIHQNLLPKDFDAEKLIVYPCRAIPRKNIGEALLLACGFPKSSRLPSATRLILALPPSPVEDLAIHKRWKALAATRHLPVEFDICSQKNISLGDLVAAAEVLLTTSVEEGFGMIFLEAWLSNKPLIGRDISSITADFRSTGLILDALYDFLGVPISLIGKEKLHRSLLFRLEEKFSAVGMSADPPSREKILHQALREDWVDFGKLEPTLQEDVIRLASQSTQTAREIIPPLPTLPSPEIIQLNRQVVENQYSLASYGLQLTTTYQKLVSAPSSPLVFGDNQAILREFLMI